MPDFRIDWKTCPEALNKGLREIMADRPASFAAAGRLIRFIQEITPERPGLVITHDADRSTVRYSRPCDAFRAVGHLLGEADRKSVV